MYAGLHASKYSLLGTEIYTYPEAQDQMAPALQVSTSHGSTIEEGGYRQDFGGAHNLQHKHSF